jgi:hypothetical protein
MSLIQNLFYTEKKKPKYLVIKDKPLCSLHGILKKCNHCNDGHLEIFYFKFVLLRTKINNFGAFTFLGCDKCNTYKINAGKFIELNVYDVCNKQSVNEKEYKELLSLYENSNNVVKFLDDFPQRRFSKDLTLAGIKKMLNHDQIYSMVVNEIQFYRPSMKNCKLKRDFNCFSILASSLLIFTSILLFFLFVLIYGENITGYISNVLESIIFSSF